jgi:hypothetical protein
LYGNNNEYDVSFKNINEEKLTLTTDEIEILKNFQDFVFNKILCFEIEFDFENSLYGGLIAKLKEGLL